MNIKCRVCKTIKDDSNFHNESRSKTGKSTICKDCKRIGDKKYREANKERIAIKKKQWAIKNKERVKQNHFNWRKDNIRYKEKISKSQKENRIKINAYKLSWHHNKYASDPLYKLKCRTRFLLKRSFDELKKNKSTGTLNALGYSYDDLVKHLNKGEYTITDYLNRSDLHIDHIIPMNYFVKLASLSPNADAIDIISKANSLDNLRIITEEQNLSKGSRLCIPLINKYKLHHLLT